MSLTLDALLNYAKSGYGYPLGKNGFSMEVHKTIADPATQNEE
jgi:hypothetical protein